MLEHVEKWIEHHRRNRQPCVTPAEFIDALLLIGELFMTVDDLIKKGQDQAQAIIDLTARVNAIPAQVPPPDLTPIGNLFDANTALIQGILAVPPSA